MAEKRMFSNKVIGSDSFLEMPDSTQNLYFHLSMYADDDGFVDKPKSIMRMTGKKEDDLKLLIAKSFVIPFDSGVLVIRHWRLNNYLRMDRYNETQYLQEKAQLTINQSGEYELGKPDGIPVVITDKIRLEKNSVNNAEEQENLIKSYNFSENLTESIKTWLAYKKEKKQNYKPTGLKTLLNKLKQDCTNNGDQYVIDSINNSIMNNYAGIFPPRQFNHSTNDSANNKFQKSNNNNGPQLLNLQTRR